jgi:RNA polymerase sigma-70 factor, ECF subfamily
MTGGSEGRERLDQVLEQLRPRLHRYCARMTGSVIDAEDVVQDAMLKAIGSWPGDPVVANPEGWVFRIAHNAALDFLRRRARYEATHSEEDLEMIAGPAEPSPDRFAVATSLRTFMHLPVSQRSAVILRDVLDYSVEEVCDIMGRSVPAIKGALQRGRTRLRELAYETDDHVPPVLAELERSRLMAYIELFNARDFDSVRDMLADDVRLDLVNKLQAKGRDDVGEYFHRYSLATTRWHCVPGFVDGRPAILMCDPNDLAGPPTYFIVLEWRNERVICIRDFLFARYAVEGAEIVVLSLKPSP